MNIRFLTLILISSVVFSASAHADCAVPVGVAGELRWIAPMMKYCDGTWWRFFSSLSDSGADLRGPYDTGRCKSDSESGSDPAGYCDNMTGALVHGTQDRLIINYGGDYDGGTTVTGPKLIVDERLGVGTTTPAAKVHIAGTQADAFEALRISNASNAVNAHSIVRFINDVGGSGAGWFLNSSTRTNDGGAGGFSFFNDVGTLNFRSNAGGISFFIGWNNPAMTITNDRNVGIGTTSPAAKLDVNGFAKLKINSTAPVACASTYNGSVALTSATRMCLCDGTSWKEVNSGTACAW